MKIHAVLPESSLHAVLERLLLIGVEDIIVSTVRTLGVPPPEAVRSFRGVRYAPELVDRCALECWPDDAKTEPAVRAIRNATERASSEATIVVSWTDDLEPVT
jgi:nitrogen regulatory protein PII